MSAITVTFVGASSTHVFENVINVTWRNEYSSDIIINQTNSIGEKITRFTVNGYIKIYGDPSDNTAGQQALENALRGVGTGTLQYTGATDVAQVRFTGLDFEEYRGSPVAKWSAQFISEPTNIHAHSPVVIGGLTLSIANGFEPPEVEDDIGNQGVDEPLNNLIRRQIVVRGRMAGTLQQVNDAQAALIAEVQDKDPNVVTVAISSATGGVSLQARPQAVSFGSQEQRGRQVARSYRAEFITYDDYTKEPYTLGEGVLVWGGITLDITSKADHNTTYEKSGTAYNVTDESLEVSGTKYFANWGAYETFVDSFSPIPNNTHLIVLNTHNTLELIDVQIGAFTRDDNFVSNAKRYSATVSLSFTWFKDLSQLNQGVLTVFLGVTWLKISSTTHSFALNETGNVSSRSVNASGQVFDANLAAAKGLLGTSIPLGDPAIPGGSDNYFLTSFNINSTDVLNTVGVGQLVVHDCSVTANQLDTNSQRVNILAQFFLPTPPQQIFFDKVGNSSKSIASVFKQATLSYEVASISMTLTGEIWEQDSAGAPGNANRGIDFFRLFDATYTAQFNASRDLAVNAADQFLPTNYQFFLNNLNFGSWEPFQKPDSPNKGAKFWKQSITLTALATFDLGQGGSDTLPDFVDTESSIVNAESTKFQELQVMGFGTVFKAVGKNPSTAQTIVQRQFKDSRILNNPLTKPSQGSPPIPLNPPSDFSFGTGDRDEIKDTFEVRGLTARWTRGWRATKEE